MVVRGFGPHLEEAFKPDGEVVSVTLINDRDTGRPKGFGFVEMATDEAAEVARVALDGTQLGGRAIKVDIAKEREPRGGGSSGGYGGGGGYSGGGGGRW